MTAAGEELAVVTRPQLRALEERLAAVEGVLAAAIPPDQDDQLWERSDPLWERFMSFRRRAREVERRVEVPWRR